MRQIFRKKKKRKKKGCFLPVMITKEGENPGKVGQDVPLSNIPHRQKQKLEGGLKASALIASPALRLDSLASVNVGGGA